MRMIRSNLLYTCPQQIHSGLLLTPLLAAVAISAGCVHNSIYPQYTAMYRLNPESLSSTTEGTTSSVDPRSLAGSFRFPNRLQVYDRMGSDLQHSIEFVFSENPSDFSQPGGRAPDTRPPASGGFAESLAGLAFFSPSPGVPFAPEGRNVLPYAPIEGGLEPGCFARYQYELLVDFNPSAVILRDAYSPYDERGILIPPGDFSKIEPAAEQRRLWELGISEHGGMKIKFRIIKRPLQVETNGCSPGQGERLGAHRSEIGVEYLSVDHDQTSLTHPMRASLPAQRYDVNGSLTDLQVFFGQLLAP